MLGRPVDFVSRSAINDGLRGAVLSEAQLLTRRELVLLAEMIEAAAQAMALVSGIDAVALDADRPRRDALLWNFTVLGGAAAQLDEA